MAKFRKGDVVRMIGTAHTKKRFGMCPAMYATTMTNSTITEVPTDMRDAVFIDSYTYDTRDLHLLKRPSAPLEREDSPQTTDELVEENVSLAKQIKSLEERLARKKAFYNKNRSVLIGRIGDSILDILNTRY